MYIECFSVYFEYRLLCCPEAMFVQPLNSVGLLETLANGACCLSLLPPRYYRQNSTGHCIWSGTLWRREEAPFKSTIQMAKADLKSAFRVCPVHPRDWQLLGIRWRTQFFIDKCLPLGFSGRHLRFHFSLYRRFIESFSSGSNYINASYIHVRKQVNQIQYTTSFSSH